MSFSAIKPFPVGEQPAIKDSPMESPLKSSNVTVTDHNIPSFFASSIASFIPTPCSSSDQPLLTHANYVEHLKTLGAPDWGITLMRQVLLLQDQQRVNNARMQDLSLALQDRQGPLHRLGDSLDELADILGDIADHCVSHGDDMTMGGPTPPTSPSSGLSASDDEWGYIDLKLSMPKMPASLGVRGWSDERVTNLCGMCGCGLSEAGTANERQDRLAAHLRITG